MVQVQNQVSIDRKMKALDSSDGVFINKQRFVCYIFGCCFCHVLSRLFQFCITLIALNRYTTDIVHHTFRCPLVIH